MNNLNSPASLQRITTSIRNKLRYLQGAPESQRGHAGNPSRLKGFLGHEERAAEEKDEELGNGRAGERRSDSRNARNDFFDGENDVDCDDHFTPSSARTRTNTTNRKPRANRRRGRGRDRGSVTPATTSIREEGDENVTGEPAPPNRRGRGRGIGRTRGRGRGRINDNERENSNPIPDSSSTPGDAELDA